MTVYATHRPSGENAALMGFGDCTSANGVAFLSCSEKVHSDTLDPLVTPNRNRSPFGDHDSGTWDVP